MTLTRSEKVAATVGVPLNSPAEFNVIPGGSPDVTLHEYGGVPPTACSDVTERLLCVKSIGPTVGVSVAVIAGDGLITSPNVCDDRTGGVELSVTVTVAPSVRSPMPVTYRLKVDPLGAGFFAELIE